LGLTQGVEIALGAAVIELEALRIAEAWCIGMAKQCDSP
jgi:hypothetical protein